MWYAIIAEDVPDSLELRLKTREAHLTRVRELADQGRVMVAGPHPAIDSEDPGAAGFSGSLLVLDFPSLVEAQQWTDSDPYVVAGVYERLVVKPFKKVLP